MQITSLIDRRGATLAAAGAIAASFLLTGQAPPERKKPGTQATTCTKPMCQGKHHPLGYGTGPLQPFQCGTSQPIGAECRCPPSNPAIPAPQGTVRLAKTPC